MLQTEHKWNVGLIAPVLLICYVVILFRVFNISIYEDTKARDFYHGDSYSDINAHSTAMYTYDYGFAKSKGLPVWKYKGDSDTTNIAVYTHYPSLPDDLAGVYAKIFNTKSESVIRIIPVLISLAFAALIFYVLNLFYKDKALASISGCIILLSNYFIFWADNLHKHQYEELLKWLFVGLIYIYYEGGKKQRMLLFWMILIFIVNANISFEPIVYMAVVTVGFSIIYDKTLFSKETILLGLAAVSGVFIHLLQNYLYFGSVELVYKDMADVATLRAVGAGNNVEQNELKRSLTWFDFANIPNLIQMRLERVFLIPGPAFFVFAYLAFKKFKKEHTKLYSILIVLLIASVSWLLLMTQHATVHCFTIRHFGIFYAVAIGVGLKEYYTLYQTKIKHITWMLILHYIFITYIVCMMVAQQFIDYFRYGILY